MSALTESTLTVDWSTGSVGSASQWVPLVSLTLDTYKWGLRVRLNQKKEKRKKGYWAGRDLTAQQGSARTGGRLGLRLAGRLGHWLRRDGLARHRLGRTGLIGQWRPKPSFSFSFLSLCFFLLWLTGLAHPSVSPPFLPLLLCFLPQWT